MPPVALLHFVHTEEFEGSAGDIPIDDEEMRELEKTLLDNPEAGATVSNTGGVRKLRLAVKGGGKRGGARVIYLYVDKRQRVYLLLAYDKSEADNLTAAGKKMMREMVKLLEAEP